MTVKRLLIALFALLAAGAVAVFLLFFERYQEDVDRGWGPLAMRNPYLAAEQFLTAAGLQTRRADNISVLAQLASNDTIYLASSSQIYNAERARELLAWIERGGHAVVVAHHSSEGERDWMLEALGVRLEEGNGEFHYNPLGRLFGQEVEEYDGKSASEMLREHNRKLREGGDSESEAAANPAEKADESSEPGTPRDPEVEPASLVNLSTEAGDYQLRLNPARLLWHPALDDEVAGDAEDAPIFWAGMESEDAGVPFMQFERGSGLITLMTDAGLWQSDRIGHFDHAYLLWLLASDGKFVFLTRPRFDSLLVLGRRYAAEFFLAGALALLAWLLLRSRRFGPRAPEPDTARRSLLEHVSACGHYYWRADKCGGLLTRYRDSLLRRLGGENANQSVRRNLCTRLRKETGLREFDIANCLWGEPPQSEETFTESMRNLQQIEAAL